MPPALIGGEALELPFHRYRRRVDDRAKFPLLILGESHAPFPADEEERSRCSKKSRGKGERLRSLGADGATGAIDNVKLQSGSSVR